MEVIWKGLKWSKNGDKGYNYILFQNLVIETELRGERYRDGGMFEWFGHNPPQKTLKSKSQKIKISKGEVLQSLLSIPKGCSERGSQILGQG